MDAIKQDPPSNLRKESQEQIEAIVEGLEEWGYQVTMSETQREALIQLFHSSLCESLNEIREAIEEDIRANHSKNPSEEAYRG